MPSENGRKLVIVESPAKAKTISRFLGPGYSVEASYGHVRDLPEGAKDIPASKKAEKWARLGVDVEKGFEPLYVVPGTKKKHVDKLKAAAKGATEILLATDEDREGESISWHILQLLKPSKTTSVRRIVFHEVTQEAITDALRTPREVDERLVEAQEARRILDRLYGYTISPVLWKRVAPGLSAGRVQSVAVRLVVERERQRIAFVSANYWDIVATLAAEKSDFPAHLSAIGDQRIVDGKSFDPTTGLLKDKTRISLTEAETKQLASELKSETSWKVSEIEAHPESRKPAPPFTTSTLQQEANRKLRFTSKKTMQIAQKLYEGVDLKGERVGLITYMRTDSTTLAAKAVEQIRSEIQSNYGSEYLPQKPNIYKTKSKNAQEAHEAIRPTDAHRKPQDLRSFLDDDEFKLYELIWKRAVACQMTPARFERTSVVITVNSSRGLLKFNASGQQIIFPGFLRAYVEGSDDPEAELGDKETLLPKLAVGQSLGAKSVDAAGHNTKPPARYTEASLVKKLEEEGIGRPSTYASIITTIQDRGYVIKRGNELIPTFTAFNVTLLLERSFDDLVDIGFTARLEDGLDDIASGNLKSVDLLSTFYFGGKDTPGILKRVESGDIQYPSMEIGLDPQTGETVIAKVGRYGAYVQKGSQNATIPVSIDPADLDLEKALALFDSKAAEPDSITTDSTTGRAVFLRTGRYGDYLELEQTEEETAKKAKPRRVSLPKGLTAADLTEEIAQKLLLLPRVLGADPETGEELSTAIGRFGPFVKRGSEFRSLKSWEEACDITLEEAAAVFKQPKPVRGKGGAVRTGQNVIKEFGEMKGAAGPVRVLSGRYGPYATDGKTNATLPKGTDPESVTAEEALKLIVAKKNKS